VVVLPDENFYSHCALLQLFQRAGTPAARKGISKFNQIGKPVNAGSMGREMPSIWLPTGWRCRLYPRSHEANGPEPSDQRYPGGVKRGVPAIKAGLMSAACSLAEPA